MRRTVLFEEQCGFNREAFTSGTKAALPSTMISNCAPFRILLISDPQLPPVTASPSTIQNRKRDLDWEDLANRPVSSNDTHDLSMAVEPAHPCPIGAIECQIEHDSILA